MFTRSTKVDCRLLPLNFFKESSPDHQILASGLQAMNPTNLYSGISVGINGIEAAYEYQ